MNLINITGGESLAGSENDCTIRDSFIVWISTVSFWMVDDKIYHDYDKVKQMR